MLRRILNCSAFLLMVIATASVALAQLPIPALTSVYPPGGKQGTSVDVSVTGQNLDDGEKLVFSHPGITAQPKMTQPDDFRPAPTKVPDQFAVTIAADVPPGVYEVRHVGRFGGSNPRAFVVGALNEATKAGGNQKKESAQEIAEGTTVTARVDANNIDYYAINLKANQRLLLDCLAQRIDSRMDATLVVFGPTGREVARSQDVEGADPVIDFTAPADGRYLIGVYDFVYGGGAEHFYRLNLTSTPHIDFVFPPSGLPGSNGQYTVYGRNLPGGQPADGLTVNGQPLQKLTVNIAIPADELARSQGAIVGPARPHTTMVDSIEYKLSTPQGNSNSVAIGIAQAPQIIEQEPNDAAAPQKVTVPCEYVGQFYPQRDQDWVQFDAKKGETYWIEAIGHRLGRSCDPSLLIQRVTKNEKGEEQVADVGAIDDAPDRNNRMGSDFDTSSDDPSFKLVVPDDGTYRVGVRDNFGDGRKDPRFVYRLVIRQPLPDFRVAVYPDVPTPQPNDQQVQFDSLVVRKGGTALLKVVVDRRDEFQGDVTLAVEGLPAGVVSSGAVIGGNVNTGSLIITATDAAAAWVGPIRIVAKANMNGQDVTRSVRTGTLVWGTQNRQQQPPVFRATRDLALTVTDKESALAHVEIGDGNVVETALGGKIELPVKVARRGELKDGLKLVHLGVPNEMKPKDLTIPNGQNEGKLEFEFANQNIKPGTYTFCMRADSKINYARNPEAIAAVENEKKQIDDAIAKLSEQLKQVTAARDQANKVAQDTKTAVQQAEQAKNQAAQELQQKPEAEKPAAQEKLTAAEKALADAQAKAKAAEEARVKAEEEVKTVDAKVKQGQQMKPQVEQRLNQVKQANQPKDINISYVSTPIKVRIHSSPVKLEAGAPQAAKAGAKSEVSVTIVRMFNFNEQVEVTLDPPAGVPGLKQVKVMIPAGQTTGKAEYMPEKNAPAGDHVFNAKAKGKFGNVNFETAGQITVKVAAAD